MNLAYALSVRVELAITGLLRTARAAARAGPRRASAAVAVSFLKYRLRVANGHTLSDTLSLTAPRSTAAELRFCSTRYQVCLNFRAGNYLIVLCNELMWCLFS